MSLILEHSNTNYTWVTVAVLVQFCLKFSLILPYIIQIPILQWSLTISSLILKNMLFYLKILQSKSLCRVAVVCSTLFCLSQSLSWHIYNFSDISCNFSICTTHWDNPWSNYKHANYLSRNSKCKQSADQSPAPSPGGTKFRCLGQEFTCPELGLYLLIFDHCLSQRE